MVHRPGVIYLCATCTFTFLRVTTGRENMLGTGLGMSTFRGSTGSRIQRIEGAGLRPACPATGPTLLILNNTQRSVLFPGSMQLAGATDFMFRVGHSARRGGGGGAGGDDLREEGVQSKRADDGHHHHHHHHGVAGMPACSETMLPRTTSAAAVVQRSPAPAPVVRAPTQDSTGALLYIDIIAAAMQPHPPPAAACASPCPLLALAHVTQGCIMPP